MTRKERVEDKDREKEHETAFKDELTREFNTVKSEMKDSMHRYGIGTVN